MVDEDAASRRIAVAGQAIAFQTIPELLAHAAACAPADAGIDIDGCSLSYAEIAARSHIVAANLRRLGIARGERVCSFMHNRREVLLAWFGTVLTGATWVPLNTGLVGKDLAHTIEDAAPGVLIADRQGVARLADPAIACHLPSRRYALDAPAPRGYAPFDQLLAPGPALEAVRIEPRDPAVIVYTGGTTGLPKGVVLPHFAMVAGGLRYREAFGARAHDRHFSVSPLFHAGGLTLSVLGPMTSGMCSTIDRDFSVSRYWQRVRASGATLINPIGVILTLLCRQPPTDADRDHRVRASVGITGQLPDGVAREFTERFGIELVNVYSLTEASGAMIVYNPLGSPRPEANGRESHWVEIAVVDRHDRRVAPNEIGEIVLRPRVPWTFMLGYHDDDAATARVWRNLWLHTGDLGTLDDDGFLFFRGREAHWLRRRGENISAYELESIMADYPGIVELAVVGAPSEIGEEEVKAFVVAERPETFDPADFVTWCAQRMAAFKVPRFVELVASLPRSTAKREVERHALRAMANDRAWDRERVFGRRLPVRDAPSR